MPGPVSDFHPGPSDGGPIVRCAFCGHEYPAGSDGLMGDPDTALTQEQARLRAWMRAELIVFEVTPRGAKALEEYRRQQS